MRWEGAGSTGPDLQTSTPARWPRRPTTARHRLLAAGGGIAAGLLIAWSTSAGPSSARADARPLASTPGTSTVHARPDAGGRPAGTHLPAVTVTLSTGRAYELLPENGRAPLLIALSGFHNTAADLAAQTGLTAFARSHGADLAYGFATSLSWNAGPPCCGTAERDQVDDIGYLRDLIADASRRADVDPARIWVVGFSNGGMLAARAACDLPEISAAVTVAGPLVTSCPRAIRLLHIHGTADAAVPIRGGWSALTHSTFPDSRTEGRRLPPGSTWALITWSGGHSWPTAGGTVDVTAGQQVRVTSLDATATAWTFLIDSTPPPVAGDEPAQLALAGH